MNIVISNRTILVGILLLFVFWLLVQIKPVLVALFVSLIFTLALDPVVDALHRRNLPRMVAVIIVFTLFILLLAVVGTASFAPVVEQTQRLIERLPELGETILGETYGRRFAENLFDQLTESSGGFFRVTANIFANALSVLTVLVFTFYLLLDFENLRERFIEMFPKKKQELIKEIFVEVETKLGSWLRGQLLLMLAVGLTTFIGLTLLRIDYALSLALISGALEIVPLLGPIIATVPALIVGFAISPVAGFGVLALYILVQQLENNFLVPKVMQKAVGLNPLVTMLALLIGAKLLGVLGALLSVPATLLAYILAKNLLLDYKDHFP